jgi:3-oxoacyl-[acyl-carrier protein] reductase
MSMFTDQVVIVTGAGEGMGRAHACLFAERGAHVVVQDIIGDRAEETVSRIKKSGGSAEVCVCDVSNVSAITEAIEGAGKRHGRIDVVVNNAGIANEPIIEEVTEELFDRMFAVNVKGPFFAARAAVPLMKQQQRGKIVNIASHWAMVGHHYASPYIGSKAAILGLTRAWAKELAPWKINVNAIAPGGVLTEMVLQQPDIEKKMPGKVARVPLGRYARPVEISYAVAFLASPEADFITGQLLSPNGGEGIVGM